MAGPSTTVTTPQGRTYTRHAGGAHLVYTPMIHAKVFIRSKPEHRGGDSQFDLSRGEEGSAEAVAGIEGGDRPLFVQVCARSNEALVRQTHAHTLQFCANDPDVLLEAAKKVENRCDAVDINLYVLLSSAIFLSECQYTRLTGQWVSAGYRSSRILRLVPAR